MDEYQDEEKLGARLDERFERILNSAADPASCPGEVSELEPVISALASLSNLLEQSFSEGEKASGDGAEQSPLKIGKYTIERCLGRGGQSVVLLANDPDLRRSVVIKLHLTASDSGSQDRSLNEARNLARVQNRHVAQCYAVDRYEGLPYLVMEHIRGRTLKQLMESGPISLHRILQIVADVADGLAAVHARGILHGDIKPGNIIIGEDDGPRIVDFGFSRPIVAEDTGRVSGTAAYMAPEQARNDVEQVDVRADVFGLGAVLYEMLTGRPPFDGATRQECLEKARQGTITAPRQLNASIPSWVGALSMRCLARDPAARIGAAELRAEIQTGLAKRKRRIWSAGAVAAIAILSLAAIFLVPGVHGPTNRAPVADQQPAAPRNVPDGALNLLKVDGTPRNDFDLDVSIVGNEPDDLGLISFVLNEEVQFEVEASRNCFITVLGLSENSDPVRLFPDARFDSYRDAFLLAGQRRQLPSPPADDHISFEPIRATTLSTGPEALCVIGSNRPLELGEAESEGRYLFFRTPEQRDELYSRLRGFTRESQKSGKSISVRILPVYVRPQGTPVNTRG